MTEPTALLTRSGVRRLRGGHPWLFADHLERVEAAAETARLVRLEGPAGHPRGYAVWNPVSRIPLRLVSRRADFVPADDPTWWQSRVDAAIAARNERLAPGERACRWVHAEADGLPGLVVDRYGPTAVVQAGCAWADGIVTALARQLVERHGIEGVLARHDGAFRRHEQLEEGVAILAGDVPDVFRWSRGDVHIDVDLRGGQKTGTFLDQRENQRHAPALLPTGRALDVCSGDGGFALQLAAAGSDVLAVDGSASACARLERNAAASGTGDRVRAVNANAFDDLRARVEADESFDAIVLDPPALAKRRAALPSALRGYKELNLRALRLLRPGGRLLSCSCSYHLSRDGFLDVLASAAADAERDVIVIEQRAAAPCHPRLLTFPESDYLKVVLLEVR